MSPFLLGAGPNGAADDADRVAAHMYFRLDVAAVVQGPDVSPADTNNYWREATASGGWSFDATGRLGGNFQWTGTAGTAGVLPPRGWVAKTIQAEPITEWLTNGTVLYKLIDSQTLNWTG